MKDIIREKAKWPLRWPIAGAALAITVIAFSAPVLAAKGGGGGGGGGSGSPSPPDYGDLIILFRDEIGVPILDENQCQQPIGFPSDICTLECDEDPCLIPLDPATCAIDMAYAACTEEADFGRTNLSRSSEDVLVSQLEDVLTNLAIADCRTLDAAGRMVHSHWEGDTLVTSTIDSPLQNLAVYRQLMLKGTLGIDLPQGASALDTAARGFGVAMDKAGDVSVDLLVYLNQIMGLTDLNTDTLLPKTCIMVKEEVMGSIELVQKCFLDYSVYDYQRSENFEALPAPAYIPEGDPEEGWFEFLYPEGDGYIVKEGPIFDFVFGDDTEQLFNIGAFAQAADDTRAVIYYMHNWPVPGEAETAVPCEQDPDPEVTYDLAISEMSGLQVPKMMVADTEGREFIVTVSNAGPDPASGSVVVTATPGAGGPVLVEGLEGPFEFEFEGLMPGLSYSTTQFFTIGEPHEVTTINWLAEVVAEFDVNPTNDAVSARTNVKVTTGGGGGKGGKGGGGGGNH
jgi:hypothetical protein